MGSSANSTETTPVILESAPHKTQSVPQNSLPLTPGECKQEAADGIMTAERMNETAQLANSPETDADVNRTALLGGEPAKRASRVDEGGRKVVDVNRTALLGGEPAERASGVDEGDEEREHQS